MTKVLIYFLVALAGVLGGGTVAIKNNNDFTDKVFSGSTFIPVQGGTGTSVKPSSGSLLVGNSSGTYDVTTTIANLNFVNGTSTNFNSSNYSGSGTFTNVSSTNFSSNGILVNGGGMQVYAGMDNIQCPTVAGRIGASGDACITFLATSTNTRWGRQIMGNSGMQFQSGSDLFYFVNSAGTSAGSSLYGGTFLGQVSSGLNAFAATINGARIDFGAGASDYASSDGTTVTFAGPVSTTNFTASGNVGIGITNPTTAKFEVQVGSGVQAIADFSELQGVNTKGAYIGFGGGAAGTTNRGYLGYASTGIAGATLFTNEIPDAMLLRSTGALQLGIGTNAALTIDTNSNVGIGTTNPASILHLNNVTTGDVAVTLDTPGNQNVRLQTIPAVNNWGAFSLNADYNGTGWDLDETTSNGWFFKLDTRGGNSDSSNNGLWLFRIPNGANPHTDESAIFGITNGRTYMSGNAGIGTETPSSTLHVIGTSTISNAMLINTLTSVQNNKLEVDGYANFNQVYAALKYLHPLGNHTGIPTITLTSASTFYPFTGASSTQSTSTGVLYASTTIATGVTSTITIGANAAGVYNVSMAGSFSVDAALQIVRCELMINNTPDTIAVETELTSANDQKQMASGGENKIRLNAGDVIGVSCANETSAGTTLSIHLFNLGITRVSR